MAQNNGSNVERAMKILLYLAEANDGAAVSEIAQALDYPSYSVSRSLKTLKEMGFVWQEKPRAPYKIGYRVLELAGKLLEGMELRQSARPFLHALAAETGMPAYLKVKTGYEVITVDVAVPPNAAVLPDEIGNRLPLHISSPGKAILAARGEDEVKEYLSEHGLDRVTNETITEPEPFLVEMQRTRERGYAINRHESSPNVMSFAAPIMRFDGKPIAAVAVSTEGRKGTLDPEKESRLARAVVESARRISFAIGYAAELLV
jgi:DNA-binding IclR family transcriptional regulator